MCCCPGNAKLVNRMLLDAGITSELIKIWKRSELQNGVIARFVTTDGGITRVYPKSAGLSWQEDAETYESSFYKRSLDNNLYIFTPSPYSGENSSDDSVLVSRAVDITIGDSTLKPAVVGVKLDISTWMTSFINTTWRMNCSDEICGCQRNHPYVDCVLLDDGGFLVMSNKDQDLSQIGHFFGTIDPVLMRTLVNASLFTFKKTLDYQFALRPAERQSKCSCAGPTIRQYVPTVADILNVGWWATAAAWCFSKPLTYACISSYLGFGATHCVFFPRSILQQLLLSFTFPNFLEAAKMQDEVSDAMLKEVCITEQTQYYFENNQLSFSGNIDCENCTRIYHAEKLPDTNLVFIISDAKLTCSSCKSKKLIQEEQQSDGPDPCEAARNPRYRKGPDICFDS
ncbi:unnamed protein product, partial [Tetraodon nigroviridis]